MIGYVSEKYESGNLGIEAIGNTKGDPGGKSYGCYQLSKVTLFRYSKESAFDIRSKQLFSPEFDDEWILAAKKYPTEFKLEQNSFLLRHSYLPLSIKARALGYPTELSAIQEMLFSLSVQHGKAADILVPYSSQQSCSELVKSVYASRVRYVKALTTLNDQLKASLQVRYISEIVDILSLLKSL